MKNIFGFGTDVYKEQLLAAEQDEVIKFCRKLFYNFPLLCESLGIDNTNNGMAKLANIIALMEPAALLELSIKACEPYLTPHDAIIRFSYPPSNTTPDDNITAATFKWVMEENSFYFYSLSRFYQSIKLWLIMSALYSISSINRERTAWEKLKPFNFGEESFKAIEDFFSKNLNNNYRVRRYLYSDTVDSHYEIMVLNGLLSNDFSNAGTIKTRNNKRDVTKYRNRLPENLTPKFFWNKEVLNSDFDYGKQELDFQLITQYLIERITAPNFIHYRGTLKAYTAALEEHYPMLLHDISGSFLNTLSFYPLFHRRLQFLESIMIWINETKDSNENSLPSEKDWEKLENDLNYQIFVYFPLVEIFFHVLLKLKYKGDIDCNTLKNELKNVYESGSMFQESAKTFSKERINSKEIKISLSDGSDFTVRYNMPEGKTIRQIFDTAAVEINYKAPKLIDCIEKVFNNYEKVKMIPESVFADFIIGIFNKRDGLIVCPNGVDDPCISEYIDCRDVAFRKYEDIIRDIDIALFENFVYEVIHCFSMDEYEYLFHYDNKTGFTPIYWLPKDDKELYGITFEELKPRLIANSTKAIQTYIDIFSKDSIIKTELPGFANQYEELLRDSKFHVDMYYQYIAKICSFLQKALRGSGYPKEFLDIKKGIIQKDLRNIKETLKRSIKEGRHSCSNIVKTLLDTRKVLPTTGSFRKEEKRNQGLYDSVYNYEQSDTDLTLNAYYHFFDNCTEFFKIESVIDSIKSDSYLYNFDMTSFESLDHDFKPEDMKIENLIKLIEEKDKELKSISFYYLNFNLANLRVGESKFIKELQSLFHLTGNTVVDEKDNSDSLELLLELKNDAQKLNIYDMIQLMNSIEEYSYLNSKVLPKFINYLGCINHLVDEPHDIPDFKDVNVYSKFFK